MASLGDEMKELQAIVFALLCTSAERILADLARDGLTITPEMRARLHAPVGLDLGADSPEHVALAIVAEMQAVLSRRDARPLRERTRPIHD